MFMAGQNLSFAQDKPGVDEIFQEARKLAFEKKDSPGAVALSKKALSLSPGYTDVRIFLGRMYNFQDQADSARKVFNEVIEQDPSSEDGVSAFADLEFWNGNSVQALQLCESGLKHHPASKDLLIKKARILVDLKRYNEASLVIQDVISLDFKNTEARALAARIRENVAKNKVGLQYDFIYFDRQFNDPWHLASAQYGRQTKLGSIGANINYASRFRSSGVQFEVDAYPRISNRFYTYISGAYSPDQGVFPSYRAGFSLYANLPESFEADAGFRYLNFGDNTWIYTGAIGKYIKNYWFNMRGYFTPGNNSLSQSYTFTGRYYFGKADDYLSLAIGSGISPDDQTNNIQLKSNSRLQSQKLTAGFRHAIHKLYILSVNAGMIRQEYQKDKTGTQIETGIGFQVRF
jgi:YaiO family outer membrane protein